MVMILAYKFYISLSTYELASFSFGCVEVLVRPMRIRKAGKFRIRLYAKTIQQ